MINLSLLQAFARANWDVGFVGFIKRERWVEPEQVVTELISNDPVFPGSVWLHVRESREVNLLALKKIVEEWNPDIVYCNGFEGADLASRVSGSFRTVATFYDPPHFGSLYKRMTELRFGDIRTRLNTLRKLPNLWRRLRAHWLEELPALSKVDVLIAHSFNHRQMYQARLNRPVLYFPNPLEPVPPLKVMPRSSPPAFLLVGSIASTVTLTGLYFFAKNILPYIIEELKTGSMQIRVVGGGVLQANLAFLRDVPNLHFLGFVSHERLLEEYGSAVALLVPTPIPLGFRTRIMDAFRYGLPTVVHSSNKAGFQELEHRGNTLMTDDGRVFAEMMRELLNYPDLRARISETAKREFNDLYSTQVFTKFVVDACVIHQRRPPR